MDKDKKRKAASVHQKHLNRARETNRPFNELLQYYAIERFLWPPTVNIIQGEKFTKKWVPNEGWKS